MRIGLYFGSFNPIHHGHLIIANYMLQSSNLEQVWFVVSPQNPLKPAEGLLNEYHRLYLIQIAIEGETALRASDIEFRLPRPSFTIDTLTYLNEKFPQHEFAVIMGSDSFQNLPRWKNFKQILANYPLYVYRRAGFEAKSDFSEGSVSILQDAPLLQISATHIRYNIREGRSIRYLLPENVREEIERNSYYK